MNTYVLRAAIENFQDELHALDLHGKIQIEIDAATRNELIMSEMENMRRVSVEHGLWDNYYNPPLPNQSMYICGVEFHVKPCASNCEHYGLVRVTATGG